MAISFAVGNSGVSKRFLKGIGKVLLVMKSQRFDRVVGVNRVVFETQNVNEDNKWQKNQAVMRALESNARIKELRKENQ